MLKHARKFKLVPVVEDQGEEEGARKETDYMPPTPPVLKKLGKLDQELRDILQDPTLSEMEKMERYESTLMKWGKYYRQFQSAENGARDNTSLNTTATTSTFPTTPSTWHSTPKTILFAPSTSVQRHRSRSPPSPPPQPTSPSFDSVVESFTTPPTSGKKAKARRKKPMTPAQAIRHSRRLQERGGDYQIGSSWLPWRLSKPRKRH